MKKRSTKKCYWDKTMTIDYYNTIQAIAYTDIDKILQLPPEDIEACRLLVQEYHCANAARRIYDTLGM